MFAEISNLQIVFSVKDVTDAIKEVANVSELNITLLSLCALITWSKYTALLL